MKLRVWCKTGVLQNTYTCGKSKGTQFLEVLTMDLFEHFGSDENTEIPKDILPQSYVGLVNFLENKKIMKTSRTVLCLSFSL